MFSQRLPINKRYFLTQRIANIVDNDVFVFLINGYSPTGVRNIFNEKSPMSH